MRKSATKHHPILHEWNPSLVPSTNPPSLEIHMRHDTHLPAARTGFSANTPPHKNAQQPQRMHRTATTTVTSSDITSLRCGNPNPAQTSTTKQHELQSRGLYTALTGDTRSIGSGYHIVIDAGKASAPSPNCKCNHTTRSHAAAICVHTVAVPKNAGPSQMDAAKIRKLAGFHRDLPAGLECEPCRGRHLNANVKLDPTPASAVPCGACTPLGSSCRGSLHPPHWAACRPGDSGLRNADRRNWQTATHRAEQQDPPLARQATIEATHGVLREGWDLCALGNGHTFCIREH